jgi:hypothetical protein
VKPAWVVACYGINDGIYHPFNEKRFAAYQDGIATLIKKVQASGARLVLLTAPPYARPGPPFPDGTSAAEATKPITIREKYSAGPKARAASASRFWPQQQHGASPGAILAEFSGAAPSERKTLAWMSSWTPSPTSLETSFVPYRWMSSRMMCSATDGALAPPLVATGRRYSRAREASISS